MEVNRRIRACADGRSILFADAWDRFLGYVKGGGAWEKDDYFYTDGVTTGTASQTRSGWTVGIGGEYAFTNYLTGFAEYDYYDFGNRDALFVDNFGGAFTYGIKETKSVFKVGLNLRWGAGPVVASVPLAGVNPASLTTTTAGIGMNFGYAWGSKGSMFAYALEGKVTANNFNGQNAGFSVSGPVSFEGTGLVWTPVSTIQNALSLLSLPNPFANIAPFPLLPANVTASNVQAGFGAGFRADDVTVAYLGVGSNKVWNFSPKIEFDLMEQLSNGSALRQYVEIVFQNKGLTFGNAANLPVTATPGTKKSR